MISISYSGRLTVWQRLSTATPKNQGLPREGEAKRDKTASGQFEAGAASPSAGAAAASTAGDSEAMKA